MPKPTVFTRQFISQSTRDTQDLGAAMGKRIRSASVLLLTGNLGSGKTAFVQGLAKGLDVPADYYITSPTYTLLNEYPGRFPLFHFDFYRLGDDMEIYSTGFYETLDSDGIVAVEWADRLSESLNLDHLDIQFTIRNDTSRIIDMTAIGSEPRRLVEKL